MKPSSETSTNTEPGAPPPTLTWLEAGEAQHARWLSESDARPPARVVVVDDSLKADDAFRLANEGTAMLWRGDYHNARQLLAAVARRIATRATRAGRRSRRPKDAAAEDPAANFHRHRLAQSQRARTLAMLLLPVDANYRIPLPRAPEAAAACEAAWGPLTEPAVIPMRAVLGAIGAYEWQTRGVDVPALGARIHPRYGVFSPVRGEYLDLIAQAPLPPGATRRAFDIGTGTGVIAALLARRGIEEVVATDLDPRALACAAANLERLGYAGRVRMQATDLFPDGVAPLVVCNPPWLPARPTTAIEAAIYDPDSRMLRGFLQGLGTHLAADGEAWLILSDLAEHLGLRDRDSLLQLFADAGLEVAGRLDTRPTHRKTTDTDDALHAARARETTSLWRLRRRTG
ncbi:MAG: methyltransferase [Rhodocyclaceae bacterium]